MFTIVVKLLTCFIVHIVRSLVATCCDSAPGVLSAPPSTNPDGHHIFSTSRFVIASI
jgi:hypothetical protein